MATQEEINDIKKIVEETINENKETLYNVVLDIKSGHFDFPPEAIYECLDILAKEIETNLINKLIIK